MGRLTVQLVPVEVLGAGVGLGAALMRAVVLLDEALPAPLALAVRRCALAISLAVVVIVFTAGAGLLLLDPSASAVLHFDVTVAVRLAVLRELVWMRGAAIIVVAVVGGFGRRSRGAGAGPSFGLGLDRLRRHRGRELRAHGGALCDFRCRRGAPGEMVGQTGWMALVVLRWWMRWMVRAEMQRSG